MLLFTIDFESVNVYGDAWIAYAAIVFDTDDAKVVDYRFRCVRRNGMDTPQRTFWTRHNDALSYLMRQVNPAATVVDLELELSTFVRSLHDQYPTMQLVGDNPAFDYAILNGILQRTGQLPMTYRNSGYAFIRDVSQLPQASIDEVVAIMRKNGLRDMSLLPHTPFYDAMCVLVRSRQLERA